MTTTILQRRIRRAVQWPFAQLGYLFEKYIAGPFIYGRNMAVKERDDERYSIARAYLS